MPFIISKTYQTVTPESAEHGDFADSGYEFEDVSYTFRELVDLIYHDGFIEPSIFPPKSGDDFWLSSDYEIEDYSTGEEISYSIHLENKSPRMLRYWFKAYEASRIRQQRRLDAYHKMMG